MNYDPNNKKKISEQIFEDVIKDETPEPPKSKFQQKFEDWKAKMLRHPKVKKIIYSQKWRRFMKSKFVANCKKMRDGIKGFFTNLKKRKEALYDTSENDTLPGFVKSNQNLILVACSMLGVMVLTITILGFIPNHICEFTEWRYAKEATCYEAGIIQSVCTCGKAQVRYSNLTEHEFGEYYLSTKATCNENGVLEAMCQHCGVTKTMPTQYIEHTYPDWTIVQNYTCVSDGLRQRYCIICNHFAREILVSPGHRYHSVEVPATPGAEGYVVNTCLACNDTYTSNIVPALGSFGLTYELIQLDENRQTYAVTGIGDCTESTIHIPATYNGIPVTMIADNAFANVKGLKSLVVNAKIVSIGSNAFKNAEIDTIYYGSTFSSTTNPLFAEANVKTVVFIGSSIPAYVLYNASTVNSIILKDTVTSIGTYAFAGCGVSNIQFSPNIQYIGSEVFAHCSNLVSIELPNYNNLPVGVFDYCTNLETIYLPKTFTKIETLAFKGCASISTIYYGGSTHDWRSVAKAHEWDYNSNSFDIVCTDGVVHKDGTLDDNLDLYFQWRLNADKVSYTLVKYLQCPEDVVIIPKSYHGLPVTAIADYAFQNANIKELAILADIRHIGVGAFSGCSNLTYLELPNSVITIGSKAFQDCINLQNITLSDNLQFYNVDMFDGSEKLQYNTYDNGLYLPSHNNPYYLLAKTTDSNLTSFIFHPDTRHMEDAFIDHDGLVSIELAPNLIYIPAYAFKNCDSLRNVIMGNEVLLVGEGLFMNCVQLQNATLSYKLTAISKHMFDGCITLTTLNIPIETTNIEEFAFNGCTKLSSLNFDSNSKMQYVGKYAFYNCVFLKTLVLPDGVTNIQEGAFSGCANLTNFTLPSMVTVLNSKVFENCGFLSVININYTLVSIDSDTFAGCRLLAFIRYSGDTSDWARVQCGAGWRNDCPLLQLIYLAEQE